MLAHAIAYAFESHAGGRKVAERETAVVHLVLGTQTHNHNTTGLVGYHHRLGGWVATC